MSGLDQTPVDPALVERFRRDVARVLGRAIDQGERIALAVSGGPDSMALLALAAAAFPRQISAATVDHRLRLESQDEARMVANWCAGIGVPHRTLVVQEPFGVSGVQARARERRYALLLRWAVEIGAKYLATAHHADDQAETFLMRASRGSGVAGLAGVRASQRREVSFPVGASGTVFDVHDVDVIRPLLEWRVTELRTIVTAVQVPFVDDPSNTDTHYERTRFRALLQGAPWLDAVQIARSAAYAAEADETIRQIEAWLWRNRKIVPAGVEDPDYQSWLRIGDLPRELKRRMCRSAITSVRAVNGVVRPAFNDSVNIEPLLDSLEAGKTATQAGIVVSVRDGIWHFREEPPRRAT